MGTAAGSAGTDPHRAFPASRVQRVTAVNSFSADRTLVAIKGKATVAADKHGRITGLGNNMDRAANQAHVCHFRLVPDAGTIFVVVIKQLLCRVPVKRFHMVSPGVEHRSMQLFGRILTAAHNCTRYIKLYITSVSGKIWTHG